MANLLDLPQTTIDSVKIIQQKKIFKNVYSDFYTIFQSHSQNLPHGKRLELGSGAGFIKDFIPDVITSDVIKLPMCDRVINAEKLPFKKNTLSAIYLLNTFHHIKNPTKALNEFNRVLKKGGKVIMIEPNNSFWGRFVYKNFHYEDFDEKITKWKVTGKGPLSDANNALPGVIFKRDQAIYQVKYPHLPVTVLSSHTPIMYLLSGGLKKRQLVPTFTYQGFKWLEKILSPLNNHFGMFITIVLTKN